jgi:shikimate dehydrogenase
MVAYNGKAKLVGVLGDPIAHSLSPAIHEYWLHKYRINGAYVPLKVKAEKFKATVDTLLEIGFVGFNVTLPHKEQAFKIAGSHDMASTICHAANTLVLQSNGNLHAMNSDAFGFVKMVEHMQQTKPFDKQSVVLLGAGGAARAIVLALQMLEVKQAVIVNRTYERAAQLVSHLQPYCKNNALIACEMADAHDYIANSGAVINSISVDGNVSETIYQIIKQTHKDAWIIDVSYGKGGTETTRMAAEAGRASVDGLTMLLWQAFSGFEQWFGVTPEVDDALINHVKQAMIA